MKDLRELWRQRAETAKQTLKKITYINIQNKERRGGNLYKEL